MDVLHNEVWKQKTIGVLLVNQHRSLESPFDSFDPAFAKASSFAKATKDRSVGRWVETYEQLRCFNLVLTIYPKARIKDISTSIRLIIDECNIYRIHRDKISKRSDDSMIDVIR
jgi:hypothetical protein